MEQKNLLKNIEQLKKKYNKALVIGKFQPLHKGHLALIDFAATQAESVVVCATAHDGELIPLARRVSWLEESYSHCTAVSVRGLSYDPSVLTESSVSDLKSSEEWADFLKTSLDDFSEVDVVIGSELYVKYMADYIGIDHIIYDEKRERLHISATDIKSDVVRYWDYLAPATKRSYARHICICGSESTGKSTTCKRLEEDYGFVTMIPELGRCLVGKSEICDVGVLKKIYSIHNELLNAVVYDPPTPIVLWDTDNITTLSYYTFLFPGGKLTDITGGKEPLLADRYYFFESDIPFHDDGTRFDSDEAKKLSSNHLQMYSKFGVFPAVKMRRVSHRDDRCEMVRRQVLEEIEELKSIFIKCRRC